jgi:hypothetical protein
MGSNHFAAIGFNVKDTDDLEALVDYAIDNGEIIDLSQWNKGFYIKLALNDGIEFWICINNNVFITGIPYFRARNTNKINIIRNIIDKEWYYESKFEVWVEDYNAENTGSVEFPFIFDCPDYVIHSQETIPKISEISITAFADKIEVYKDIPTFRETRAVDLKLAVKAFIPIGIFEDSIEAASIETSNALFTGVVKEAELITNSLTGKEFYRISVETLTLTIDVMAEKSKLEHIPEKNNIVQVYAWVIGDWINH